MRKTQTRLINGSGPIGCSGALMKSVMSAFGDRFDAARHGSTVLPAGTMMLCSIHDGLEKGHRRDRGTRARLDAARPDVAGSRRADTAEEAMAILIAQRIDKGSTD